jgi:ferritin-like protein
VDEIFPEDVKDVAVIAPVFNEVDEIFPEEVKDVAVIAPVFNEVDEILPDDVKDVAVINPAAKPPLPSRLTIVFAVLDAVAELIADENVL